MQGQLPLFIVTSPTESIRLIHTASILSSLYHFDCTPDHFEVACLGSRKVETETDTHLLDQPNNFTQKRDADLKYTPFF